VQRAAPAVVTGAHEERATGGAARKCRLFYLSAARQAPTAVTGRLVDELKAKRQHEGENTLEKRLPIAKQMKVRCFVSKIDSDGPVFAGPFGCVLHVSPPHSTALPSF